VLSEDDEGAPWSAPDSDPPAHRCGFELLPGDLDSGEEYDDLDEWRTDTASASCCREVWEDGRCRWHAGAEPEVLREAVAERDERVQNLDGVVLRDVELEDSVSFAGCWLRGATFENVTAREADFADCNLYNAQFPDADLRRAQFPDAFLPYTQFPDADLQRAQFPDAYLHYAQFPDADLHYAQFPDANLYEAQFPDADLPNAQFPDAYLRDAQFPDANLRRAQFPDAYLHSAQFPESNLRRADLTRADARRADFTPDDDTDPTNLEDAVLRETDLRGADLSGTRLYQTDLTDARINRKTTFDDTTVYERNPELSGWFRDTTDAYGAAAWVHRRLERLHESAAASEEARRYHIRKQEAERAGHKRRALGRLREVLLGDDSDSGDDADTDDDSDSEDDADTDDDSDSEDDADDPNPPTTPLVSAYRYLSLSLMYHLSKHGESLQRIGWRATQIILVAGVLYPLAGGIASDSTNTTHEFPARAYLAADTVPEALSVLGGSLGEFLWGLYFSVITFTTIGYGDLYPVGTAAKVLVGVESLSGAVLVALFVFVLGRRVAR
jgi:uncharacterized protein YjbI with pentapeptide repeats